MDQSKLLEFLKERVAELDQRIADLCQMEEFVNCGYVDIRPIPVGHDESYEHYSGKMTAWVTPQCPSADREAAAAIVKKLEDESFRVNDYLKTSTPVTSVLFVNICKAVRTALEDARKTMEEAYRLGERT